MKVVERPLSAELMAPVLQFLHCQTPQAWVETALENIDTLLIDHAHCEKKAASTALSLMYRYPEKTDLVLRLSKIAREELRHFEQVVTILRDRQVAYVSTAASRYAESLFRITLRHEPAKLIDTLILGAIIEARSCERFYCLIPHLDEHLAKFYTRLLSSEARHFQTYLDFAREFADEPIDQRVNEFLQAEKQLIEGEDDQFRFHSGVPVNQPTQYPDSSTN